MLDLLRQEQANEVIKIKTMTSAEIQLNPFLEAATAFMSSRPIWPRSFCNWARKSPRTSSCPALHVNRSQVREIFARRMGLKRSLRRPPRR
jgi:L-lactate dehydrogenase complex protein LldF